MLSIIPVAFNVLGTILQLLVQLALIAGLFLIGIVIFRALITGLNFVQSADGMVKNFMNGSGQEFQRPSSSIDRGTIKGALKLGIVVCMLLAFTAGSASVMFLCLFITLLFLFLHLLLSKTLGERSQLTSATGSFTNSCAAYSKMFKEYVSHFFKNAKRMVKDEDPYYYDEEDNYFDPADESCMDDYPDITNERARQREMAYQEGLGSGAFTMASEVVPQTVQPQTSQPQTSATSWDRTSPMTGTQQPQQAQQPQQTQQSQQPQKRSPFKKSMPPGEGVFAPQYANPEYNFNTYKPSDYTPANTQIENNDYQPIDDYDEWRESKPDESATQKDINRDINKDINSPLYQFNDDLGNIGADDVNALDFEDDDYNQGTDGQIYRQRNISDVLDIDGEEDFDSEDDSYDEDYNNEEFDSETNIDATKWDNHQKYNIDKQHEQSSGNIDSTGGFDVNEYDDEEFDEDFDTGVDIDSSSLFDHSSGLGPGLDPGSGSEDDGEVVYYDSDFSSDTGFSEDEDDEPIEPHEPHQVQNQEELVDDFYL